MQKGRTLVGSPFFVSVARWVGFALEDVEIGLALSRASPLPQVLRLTI